MGAGRLPTELTERLLTSVNEDSADTSQLRFEDLFNIQEIQAIQDAFAEAMGVASMITDPQGRPLTRPSHFCRLCEQVIRKTEKGLANCMASDAALGRLKADSPIMQPCLSAGLWDGGTSICAGDRHVANWLIGQVRDSSLDDERLMQYAQEIGADPEEFRSALAQVPQMSREQFAKVCQALFLIARQLSQLATQNLLQARYIAERKRTEEAVRQSEAEPTAAQRLAHIGSWQWDIRNDTALWSEETFRIFGIAGNSLERHRKNFVDMVSPEDRQRVDRALADALSGAGEYDLDYRIRLADGSEKVIHAQGEVFRGDDGQPLLMRGTVQDITQRREAEERLRSSQHQLNKAQEIAHLGSWELDLTTNHLSWSDEVYCIFGLAPQEFGATYEAFLEAVHPEDRAAVREAYDGSLRENRDSYEIEHRVVRKSDGQVRVVQEKCEHIRDVDGRIVRSVGIVHDITDRKQAEEALRQSERRFRVIFDNAGVGILEAIGEQFIAVNDCMCRILGYGREELLRMNVHELTYPDDRARSDELNAALREGRCDRLDYDKRYLKRDGSPLWVHVTVSPVRGEEGRWSRFIATTEDIGERKRAEQELAEAKASAERAKVEAERWAHDAEGASKAKDHFLAVLSHELRNPLNPVLAVASMLRDNPRFDADTREQLEIICRNAELEARLIDDLLDVTRIERGKIELDRRPIDLGIIIRRAVEVCLPDIEARQLEFGVDLGPAPYCVDADAARLQQVFWNLLKNSIKFTPPGGCVGIRCRRGEGQVIVEVNDSGVGIEPEMLPRLFNAFEQAERSITRQFGGLGLGLTISKAMVEMHGGSIEAYSEGKGKGATFTVRLPLLPAEAAVPTAPPTSQAPTPAAPPRPLRILLVEDHGDTARVMRRLLEAGGNQVEHAADVAMALKLAEEQAFDLLLSDLGLPDGSGLDLMRGLRQRGSKLPGIALSGYGQETDVQQSRAAGFAAHLTKPVSLPKLEEAIAALATGSERQVVGER